MLGAISEFILSEGFVISAGVVAILFAVILAVWIMKQSEGKEEVSDLSNKIYEGAMTFLNNEYKPLSIFVVIVTLVLLTLSDAWLDAVAAIPWQAAPAFVGGAIFSALAGNIGMRIATKSNARAAVGADESMGRGLRIAFSSGGVMGMMVVGLALIGLTVIFLLDLGTGVLVGFGFGASSIALFARVAGGIYTKSADMGADLVGKVEEKIPEDDPRNPAAIADNVGDNVGDVAGMGADLFESYAGSIISAIALGSLGAYKALGFSSSQAMLYPLLLAAIGIFASIIATFFVRTGDDPDLGDLHKALNKGTFGAAGIMIIFSAILTHYFMGSWNPFFVVVIGLLAGISIGLACEYYTESRFNPTKSVAESSKSGHATNIVTGFSVGLKSTLMPVISIAVAIWLSYWLVGLYGIPIAAVGMLSTLGITLATDTYGPVNDNAAGIAEMGEMGQDVREKAEKLDAVGNTTAAIGKGFAIGSAALTAVALFVSFTEGFGGSGLELSLINPPVFVGLLIGALLTFFFSALTMSSVGKAASLMVEEVRRQFSENPGILDGEVEPDYEKCIKISTDAGIKYMVVPGAMAIIVPLIVGIINPAALGGLLAGAIGTGLLLAITLSNSGGSWDNAKKYIEEGNFGGKGSEAHAASVTGDTVGDPFKDTSGPALNILIKLMAMVSLLFVPIL